jgi:hypothetical protein
MSAHARNQAIRRSAHARNQAIRRLHQRGAAHTALCRSNLHKCAGSAGSLRPTRQNHKARQTMEPARPGCLRRSRHSFDLIRPLPWLQLDKLRSTRIVADRGCRKLRGRRWKSSLLLRKDVLQLWQLLGLHRVQLGLRRWLTTSNKHDGKLTKTPGKSRCREKQTRQPGAALVACTRTLADSSNNNNR